MLGSSRSVKISQGMHHRIRGRLEPVPCNLSHPLSGRLFCREILCIECSKFSLIHRHLCIQIDSTHGACRLARCAINAIQWMYKTHSVFSCRDDAIYRANCDTGLVHHIYAGTGNHISHNQQVRRIQQKGQNHYASWPIWQHKSWPGNARALWLTGIDNIRVSRHDRQPEQTA